jgi:hypothetical protein
LSANGVAKQGVMFSGLARTIKAWCIYSIFGRDHITNVRQLIHFWPTLEIWQVLLSSTKKKNALGNVSGTSILLQQRAALVRSLSGHTAAVMSLMH